MAETLAPGISHSLWATWVLHADAHTIPYTAHLLQIKMTVSKSASLLTHIFNKAL